MNACIIEEHEGKLLQKYMEIRVFFICTPNQKR